MKSFTKASVYANNFEASIYKFEFYFMKSFTKASVYANNFEASIYKFEL